MSASNPTDLKSRMKHSYDAIAQTYFTKFVKSDDPRRLSYLSRIINLLKDSKKDSASILELGCGAGIPSTKALLQQQVPKMHVTANDLSSVQIDMARANLSGYEDEGRLKLVEGDMTTLDFPNATFDVVVGFYSVIHLPRGEQTEFMKKIVQWLRPSGLFLANFAQEELESGVNPKWLGEEEGWVYWSSWGEEGSVRMVEEAGLEVLVREITEDIVDANFLWVIGRKKQEIK